MENVKVNKLDLFNYTFYDDNQRLCVVLNKEYLKELFNADIIMLEETEHK